MFSFFPKVGQAYLGAHYAVSDDPKRSAHSTPTIAVFEKLKGSKFESIPIQIVSSLLENLYSTPRKRTVQVIHPFYRSDQVHSTL